MSAAFAGGIGNFEDGGKGGAIGDGGRSIDGGVAGMLEVFFVVSWLGGGAKYLGISVSGQPAENKICIQQAPNAVNSLETKRFSYVSIHR